MLAFPVTLDASHAVLDHILTRLFTGVLCGCVVMRLVTLAWFQVSPMSLRAVSFLSQPCQTQNT